MKDHISYFLTNNAEDSARISSLMGTANLRYVLSDAPISISVQRWLRSNASSELLSTSQKTSAKSILQLPLYEFKNTIGDLTNDDPVLNPPTSIEEFRAKNALWASLLGGFAFMASEKSLSDFEILRMSTWCAANGLKTIAIIPKDFSGGRPSVLAACDFCIGETNISSLSTLISTL